MNNNIYGDHLDKGVAGRGVDIALQRADDLDRKCLKHLSEKQSPAVLDLGSGAGGHSLRMVKVGAVVTAVDRYDFSAEYSDLIAKNNIVGGSLVFIKGEIENLPELLSEKEFEDVYTQRTLHYLKYDEAKQLLTFLHTHVKDSIFLSVTGITTEIAQGYVDRDKPVNERFSEPQPEVQKTHHVKEKVCLYSKEELVKLLEDCNWKIKECWLSDFGNIKVIATH